MAGHLQPTRPVDVPEPRTLSCAGARLSGWNCTPYEWSARIPRQFVTEARRANGAQEGAGEGARVGKQGCRTSTGHFSPPMASEPDASLEPAMPDEAVFPEDVHVVERPDLWHPIVDMAVRRTGRPGRAGQSLFPHQGPQDRPLARL